VTPSPHVLGGRQQFLPTFVSTLGYAELQEAQVRAALERPMSVGPISRPKLKPIC